MEEKIEVIKAHYEALLKIQTKWEDLDKKIAAFYVDKDGNELPDDGDGLISIGETAAHAFGWL